MQKKTEKRKIVDRLDEMMDVDEDALDRAWDTVAKEKEQEVQPFPDEETKGGKKK